VCGIGAVYDPAGADDARTQRMLDALRHRGPDGCGAQSRGPTTLLHTRLAIIDVAGGDQPLVSEDGSCSVVVNGEIYNHLELRRELEALGHRFATHSDCEVVVHGYEQWGDDITRRLNGMFAFALWHDRRARLLLARDPFGIKPLYWWSDGTRFLASSEIHALLAAGVPAELDEIALDHYLSWRFVPAPRTLFAGICKLPAAGIADVVGGAVRVSSYRDPPAAELTDTPDEELAAELQVAIRAAVDRQRMSDVPYGAFLSGGLDSAMIAAALRDAAGAPPRTFTIGFPGHAGAVDERAAAAATARAIGTRHRDTAMTMVDFVAEFDRCVRHIEEPCGSPSATAALQLSRFAAADVKVVLSGQGADEPLGGYQRHLAAAWSGALGGVPGALTRPLHAAAEALPRNERAKRAAAMLGAGSRAERLLRIFEITTADSRTTLVGPSEAAAVAAAERASLAGALLADVPDRDALGQMLYLDARLFLPDQLLLWGDKTSMAASLEQRVPFLDVELMRFVDRIPARRRVGLLQRKRIYRRAARGVVPEIVLRRRKQPFATPYDAWLRAELGEEVLRRYAPGRPVTAHIRPAAVERLVAEHRSGRHDRKRILFCLLELSQWHARFLEQVGSDAAPTPA
jgi:asparagine synthase (glutamine-hydrolysing)